ncbi:hypothetical protein DB44_EB00030 [Candidatus Protochlamydia amoebophila]|uniref:Uncharacterized protein n=1 Tax=Candidatus Protochlamydia amoebophila TaxID=362787 RepID=A0A0C1H8S2_9BACT|nr:hypothetical protein DB44_EB00030 [Candidatus Protochlamydia amoebophila]
MIDQLVYSTVRGLKKAHKQLLKQERNVQAIPEKPNNRLQRYKLHDGTKLMAKVLAFQVKHNAR